MLFLYLALSVMTMLAKVVEMQIRRLQQALDAQKLQNYLGERTIALIMLFYLVLNNTSHIRIK
jgi:hypothetical protein